MPCLILFWPYCFARLAGTQVVAIVVGILAAVLVLVAVVVAVVFYRKRQFPPRDEERRFTLDEVCVPLFLTSVILVFLASISSNLVLSLWRGIISTWRLIFHRRLRHSLIAWNWTTVSNEVKSTETQNVNSTETSQKASRMSFSFFVCVCVCLFSFGHTPLFALISWVWHSHYSPCSVNNVFNLFSYN